MRYAEFEHVLLLGIAYTMIITIIATYDGVITLGEIIAIVITLVITTAALLKWGLGQWGVRRSFSVDFPAGNYEIPGKLCDSKEVPLGQHDILVRIKVKSSLNIRQVNFRFFKNLRGTAEASVSDIRVLNIWERELEYEREVRGPYTPRSASFTAIPDTLGGYDGLYSPGFHKSANSYLWYRVIIGAYKPSKVYLSFQCEGTNGQRQNVRRKLEIIDVMPSTPDTQHVQPKSTM